MTVFAICKIPDLPLIGYIFYRKAKSHNYISNRKLLSYGDSLNEVSRCEIRMEGIEWVRLAHDTDQWFL
jgi:hypothetical protein